MVVYTSFGIQKKSCSAKNSNLIASLAKRIKNLFNPTFLFDLELKKNLVFMKASQNIKNYFAISLKNFHHFHLFNIEFEDRYNKIIQDQRVWSGLLWLPNLPVPEGLIGKPMLQYR